MKVKHVDENLTDIEFSFPLEGIVIKAKTLEDAQAELARRKNPKFEEGE